MRRVARRKKRKPNIILSVNNSFTLYTNTLHIDNFMYAVLATHGCSYNCIFCSCDLVKYLSYFNHCLSKCMCVCFCIVLIRSPKVSSFLEKKIRIYRERDVPVSTQHLVPIHTQCCFILLLGIFSFVTFFCVVGCCS